MLALFSSNLKCLDYAAMVGLHTAPPQWTRTLREE
jgi:hypothetical protein